MITNWKVTVYVWDDYELETFVLHNLDKQDALAKVAEIISDDPDVDAFTIDEIGA